MELNRQEDAGTITAEGLAELEQLRADPGPPPEPKFSSYTLPGGENYRELLLRLPTNQNEAAAARSARIRELTDRRDDLEAQLRRATDVGRGPEGSLRALRSLRRQIRNAEMQISVVMRETNDRTAFTRGHFDEPNVLAHIRFNERTDADGKRVLFIEEIQSDWHQKGRKEGYTGENKEALREAMELAKTKASTVMRRVDDLGFDTRGQALQAVRMAENWTETWDVSDLSREDIQVVNQYIQAVADYRSSRGGVPDAPFKTSWHELAFKRMLRYAASSGNGYDRIAWTTGEQQVERYTSALRNTVDRVEWTKTEEGVHLVGSKNGQGVVDTTEAENELSDAIGKAMAQQILESPDQTGVIEGDNIRIDATWPALLYNKKLRRFANKYAKKWGAKVGETKISGGSYDQTVGDPVMSADAEERYLRPGFTASERQRIRDINREMDRLEENTTPTVEFRRMFPALRSELQSIYKTARERDSTLSVHSLDVTPAMRESVTEGQPLFAIEDAGWYQTLTEQAPGFEKDVLDILRRIAPGAKHRVINGILHRARGPLRGEYSPVQQLIIATDPATARHEAIHHLRNVGAITATEWDALKDMAKKVWMDQYKIRENYTRQYKGRLPDADFEELLLEEAVAHAYEEWTGGNIRQRNAIQRIFQKIKRFLQDIGALKTKYADVLERIEAGEVGQRTGRRGDIQAALNSRDPAQISAALAEARQLGVAFTRTEISQALRAANLDGLADLYENTPGDIVEDLAPFRAALGKRIDKAFDAIDAAAENLLAGKESVLAHKRTVGTPEEEALLDDVMVVGSARPGFIRSLYDGWKTNLKGDEARKKLAWKTKAALVDSLYGTEFVERKLSGNWKGALEDAVNSMSKLFRMTRDIQSYMGIVLKHGPLRLVTEANAQPGETVGDIVVADGFKGGLEGIYKKLGEQGVLDWYKLWAAGVRADRLMRERYEVRGGKQPGWFENEAAAKRHAATHKGQIKDWGETGREKNFSRAQIDAALKLSAKYPEANFEAVHERAQQFNKAMLDFAQDSGTINAETRKFWERNDYIPFARALDETTVQGSASAQSPIIRMLTGGKAEDKAEGKLKLDDPIEALWANATHLVHASLTNQAMLKAEENIKDAGVHGAEIWTDAKLDWRVAHASVAQVTAALKRVGIDFPELSKEEKEQWLELFTMVPPKDADIVTFREGGKVQYRRVHDQLFLEAIVSLQPKATDRLFTLMSIPKNILTTSVTATGGFMVANSIRDTLHAWVIMGKERGFVEAMTNLPKLFVDVFASFGRAGRGAKESFQESADVIEMLAAGGGTMGYYGTRPDQVRKMIESLGTEGAASIIGTPRKAWTLWMKIGRASEMANRVAIYKQAKADGASNREAAYQARDLLDFSRHGSLPMLRFFTVAVPFLNARIQGIDRLKRSAQDNPTAFMFRGAILTGMTMGLMLQNDDDDRYNRLEEWDKDVYYHIFLDHFLPDDALREIFGSNKLNWHIRVPKPFEVGLLFSTVWERLYQLANGNDDGKAAMGALGRAFHDTLAFDPVPQAIKPLAEQMANKSFFTQRQIVGERLAGQLPSAQVTPHTTGTARAISALMNAPGLSWLFGDNAPFQQASSPARIDALIRGYSGTIGASVAEWAGMLFNVAAGRPAGPTPSLSQVPLIGRFVKEEPYFSTKYTTRFYEMRNEAQAIMKTFNAYRQVGNVEAAREILEKYRPQIRKHRILDRNARNLARLRAQERIIREHRDMPRARKREELNRLQELENTVTERIIRILDKIPQ